MLQKNTWVEAYLHLFLTSALDERQLQDIISLLFNLIFDWWQETCQRQLSFTQSDKYVNKQINKSKMKKKKTEKESEL